MKNSRHINIFYCQMMIIMITMSFLEKTFLEILLSLKRVMKIRASDVFFYSGVGGPGQNGPAG